MNSFVNSLNFIGHRSTGESVSEHDTSEAVFVGIFLKIMVAVKASVPLCSE